MSTRPAPPRSSPTSMPPLVWLLTSTLTALVACGGDGSGGSGGSPAEPTCYDSSGNATSSCAVKPSGTVCSRGDANDCAPLQTLAVYAATDAKTGPCMHLVFDNQCGQPLYADTCIATNQDPEGWQCWTSSVSPGGTIDVSQCGATGKYFFVSTLSSGLDTLEPECQAPLSH